MCDGCDEELGQAIYYQDEFGLYFATSVDNEFWHDEHFTILMVDNEGKIRVS